MSKATKISLKILKILGWIILGVVLILIVVLLFIRSPWGQGIIVDKAEDYVTSRTGTRFEIDRLFVTFSGNVFLEGLFVEDQQADTLLYSESLETGVAILPLISSGAIHVNKLEWNGVTARVFRDEESGKFNYEFLIEALAGSDTTATEPVAEDTASSGYPDIDLGPVALSNMDLVYNDPLMGIEAQLKVGLLSLEMERLNLNKMDFYIRDFLFDNSTVFYRQTKPFEPTAEADTTQSPMPLVIVDRFAINNVTAYYESEPDGMLADVDLGEFLVELPEANLEDNTVDLKTLRLHNSAIMFKTAGAEGTEPEVQTAAVDTVGEGFIWPDWTLNVRTISLENNQLTYQTGDESPQVGSFNPSAISLEDFIFKANNIFLREERAGFQLEEISFEEASGFNLKRFSLSMELSDESVQLSDIYLATNRSNLEGEARVRYASLEELINFPDNSEIDLDATLSADIRDGYFFSPALAENSYLKSAAQRPITAELAINGSMDLVNIDDFAVRWGNSTSLNVSGSVANPLETEQLRLDLPVLNFRSQRSDLVQFVNEEDLGIKLPEEISLESEIDGSLNDLLADVRIQMPEGNIELEGKYADLEQIAFDAQLRVEQLELDELLQNDQLGSISFSIHTHGKGNSLQDLDAVLTSEFEALEYGENNFKGLTLEGKMEDGSGHLDLAFKGANLDIALNAFADLDSVSPNYQVKVDLEGADLLALGVSSRALRASGQLEATFEGDPEAFDLVAGIADAMVVYDRRPFQLGPVAINARVRPDTTSLDLSADMVTLNLRSNASPQELGSGINRHLNRYLSDSTYADTVTHEVVMEMDMSITPTPILQQVFLEGLDQLDSGHVAVNFREAERHLTAVLNIPYVLYNNIEVDSLRAHVNAVGDSLSGELGLVAVEAGPVSMGRTWVTGQVEEDQRFHIDLISFDEEDTLMYLGSNIRAASDTTLIEIEPDILIFNKKVWSIPEDNRMLMGDNFLQFENFSWTREDQELHVRNDVEGVEEEHVGISFKGFRLAVITSLLNPEALVADGFLEGRLIFENLFEAPGIIADLDVDSLQVTGVPLGDLSLVAKSTEEKGYDFNLALKEGDVDLDLVGDYVAAPTGAELNMNLVINELKLIALERLTEEQIRDTEGTISGNISLSGTTTDPVYEGEFQFNEAVFTVSTLNSRFTLSNEAVRLDNEGVYLDAFSITDADNNDFTVDGEVLTEDFANPVFDLNLNAENFQALNSSSDDNDLFYGTLILNTDLQISGDLNQPQVKGSLLIRDDTDLTFVIPETELTLVERDGVVLFVDRENPDDILTRVEDEPTTSELSGIQLSANITVEPNAVFNVVVDQRSGDNLRLGGESQLLVNMDPNGRITLSGKYEVNAGHYEMSLYNIVSRRFEIDEGSSVTFAGDPMDASLDIRAIYRIETSPSELMASQLGGANSETINQYRQELPFLVYLNVEGDLLQPVISFGLDMPEDQQGVMGGNVYTRVQQINTQEDELNKQVFSLLVLNRFFPATGSDGSGGGTTAMARSSVSQLLSDQLNAFSNSLFGGSGLELDFDLDSFQDYREGTGQNRTQLNVNAQQSLFNDRLVVNVGSQMDVEGSSPGSDRGNPVFGNVSVEYLLTENGRYRLRGFRKNQFESVIDGQLIITGLSLIFNREFNEFWELWKGIDPEEERNKSKEQEKEDGARKPEEGNEEGAGQ